MCQIQMNTLLRIIATIEISHYLIKLKRVWWKKHRAWKVWLSRDKRYWGSYLVGLRALNDIDIYDWK